LLEEDGNLIGVLKYEPLRGGDCHLVYLLVRADRRGNGLAGQLLDEFLRRLAGIEHGVVVEAEINSEEEVQVRHLLEKRGFISDGIRWRKQLE
jgi:GNAT superfamily N-acetyltransferase